MIYTHVKPNDPNRWERLRASEQRRETVAEWVAIVCTVAAFVALVLILIALYP